MAFQDQYGSWSFGENFNYDPNSQCYEDRSLGVNCTICWGRHGSNHDTEICLEKIERILAQRVAQRREDNLWDSRVESSQDFGLTSSSGRTFGEQEEETRTQTCRLLNMMETMLAAHNAMKTDTENALAQHIERIQALEQAKSSSDKVVQEQARTISSLEDTMKKLETRLKNQQHEQMKQYEANVRRIKQLNTEVFHLREQINRADAMLCQVRQEQVNHIRPCYISDDDEEDVIRPDLGDQCMPSTSSEQKAISEIKKELCIFDEYLRVPSIEVECFQVASPVEKENQVNFPNGDIKALINPVWEAVQILMSDDQSNELNGSAREHFEELISPIANDHILEEEHSHIESVSVQKGEAENSCSDCGLNCIHQLRACVNMINVMPSVKKVKAKEIRDLKRTTKRKIQKQWVPRGIFDIKEQFESNMVNVEDSCVKSYMPQWRKRKRRTPSPNDSND